MKEIQVVAAVIYEEDRGFLCALRGTEMTLAGFWEFPGGKVESDENHRRALKREIKEELQCEVEVGAHIVSVIHDYEQLRVHLHTYWTKLVQGTPIVSEHDEIRWVSLDHLMNLKWAAADLPTVQKLVSLAQHNKESETKQ